MPPTIEAEPTSEVNKDVVLVGAPVTSILAEVVKLRSPPNVVFLEVSATWLAVTAPVILILDKKLEPVLTVKFLEVPASVTDPLI